MTEPIRGRVASILNSRDLVINRGGEAGVRLGMKFAVLDPAGQDITDPETGSIIGSVSRTKVQVEVTQVTDKLAVARTYRHSTVNIGGIGSAMGDIARMFTPPRYVERAETFKTSEADWEPLTESESIVKRGDPVVQIEVGDDGIVGGVIAEINDTDNSHARDNEVSLKEIPSDQESNSRD
jgi:hypothetical protein